MITGQDAWKIVSRFRKSITEEEKYAVYELVRIIDCAMIEQEVKYDKEQKNESENL